MNPAIPAEALKELGLNQNSSAVRRMVSNKPTAKAGPRLASSPNYCDYLLTNLLAFNCHLRIADATPEPERSQDGREQVLKRILVLVQLLLRPCRCCRLRCNSQYDDPKEPVAAQAAAHRQVGEQRDPDRAEQPDPSRGQPGTVVGQSELHEAEAASQQALVEPVELARRRPAGPCRFHFS